MPQNYVPIFLFLAVVGILIPVTLLVAQNYPHAKSQPREADAL